MADEFRPNLFDYILLINQPYYAKSSINILSAIYFNIILTDLIIIKTELMLAQSQHLK